MTRKFFYLLLVVLILFIGCPPSQQFFKIENFHLTQQRNGTLSFEWTDPLPSFNEKYPVRKKERKISATLVWWEGEQDYIFGPVTGTYEERIVDFEGNCFNFKFPENGKTGTVFSFKIVGGLMAGGVPGFLIIFRSDTITVQIE